MPMMLLATSLALSDWALFLIFLFVFVTSGRNVVKHWPGHDGGLKLRRFWNEYLMIGISLYVMGSVVLSGFR